MTTPLTSYRLPSTRTDLPVVPICRRRPRLPEAPETLHVRPVPRLSRGALRDRHERWVRDAMDARARRTNAPRSRTAKSCGSGVPTLTPSWQRCFCIVACDGGNQARSPGRARSKPLKPFARGSRIDPVEPVVTLLVCFLFLRTRLRVSIGIRLSLRPLIRG